MRGANAARRSTRPRKATGRAAVSPRPPSGSPARSVMRATPLRPSAASRCASTLSVRGTSRQSTVEPRVS
eukprot:7637205-Alexandrium_andersonii.AAC.1